MDKYSRLDAQERQDGYGRNDDPPVRARSHDRLPAGPEATRPEFDANSYHGAAIVRAEADRLDRLYPRLHR